VARDEFSATTKSALAKRAGFRCSYPACQAVTIGPSDEGNEATANTGEAAHISAASSGKGSRRYDPTLTSKQRSSIDNGLWCCSQHAKLIDTDEVTYTIEMLKKWRVLAEKRAQLRQAYGDHLDGHVAELLALGLAPETISLQPKLDLNATIGAAVENSWITEISGKESASVLRDFLIEYTRNAFTHGNARSITIHFNANAISIEDDGNEFQVANLRSKDSRGGGMAYRELLALRQFGHTSYRRSDGLSNHLHIPFVANARELPKGNPCAISLNREDLRTGQFDVSYLTHCDRAFIIARDFLSYSDAPLFAQAIRAIEHHSPNLTLILPEVSAGVLQRFKEIFPNLTIESC
jgi:hypothetical protein